ncbi:SRPBCC family protein [Chitinophaga japonensis]|uniref:Polyketide cyclase/dehydrase/lipid transport protein n=1 Tax=Chitinophaga japonensis TaxID=104662 RepID=A0A562TEV3_CHIJA|nr:SRPBCC family protein [Chitinophaga japonensis]TWI91794.1 polyketide cyclase/dehydrase/lipid transport protein [Chitinophaga japonensis]
MKVLKVLLWIVGIILLIGVILLVAAPTKMHIERSVAINAPASQIWPHLVNYASFNDWNPWYKMDTAAQYTITGQDGTVGAASNWKGEKIGEGRLETTAMEPYTSVQQQLTFIKPWESTADCYYRLSENAGVTTVTWGFDSEFPRPQNIMGLFMKGSLEKDYDNGLQDLKKQVEQ